MPKPIHVLIAVGAGEGRGTDQQATDVNTLENWEDCTVTVVDDLERAIEEIANGVDCLVVDHDPPAIDGLEVTAAVRDRVSGLPVVLWPTAGSESLASAAFAAGVDDYLPRTADSQATALVNRVRSVVASSTRIAPSESDSIVADSPGMLASLLDTIPRWVSIFFKDRQGRHVAVNEHRLDRLSETPHIETPDEQVLHSREDILGKTDFDLYPTEHAIWTRRDEQRIMRTETPVVNQKEHVEDPIGRDTYMSVTKAPWYDTEGSVCGIVGIAVDISDRVHRELELERQNERLDRFAGAVSHDLRNPLTVACGSLLLAMEELDPDDETEAYSRLEDVEYSLDRIDELVDDMLVLARQGKTADRPEPTSLYTVAEEAWRTVDADGGQLVCEEGLTVVADPERLRTALENLFRNSVEHGSTGSEHEPRSDDAVEHGPTNSSSDESRVGVDEPSATETETVTVTVGPLDDHGFYVADDGPGIPADEREAVFDHGYSTAETGTGFGLAIVEEIANAHGWSIEVTESIDGGARFEWTGVAVVDAEPQN
ncbi:ATP-binding protein [Halobacteria archaeon AArc-m2/3/4]|uniref:histidine kinase n=1 Tax=Natronoglomus mannanivorans TaxID=2979990 RepID=A0ABT2QFJ2_9EURY|nr:ATP-binding protein [Halobacteria archaeon AArc-m2/3/4]